MQRPSSSYEFEVGKVTLGQLLNEVCGGPLPGRKFKAVIPGGSSAKVLKCGEIFTLKNKDGSTRTLAVEDIPMDFDTLAAVALMGGSGGVIVMDDSAQHGLARSPTSTSSTPTKAAASARPAAKARCG